MTAKSPRERFNWIKQQNCCRNIAEERFLIELVEAAVEYAGEEIYTKYVNFKDEKDAQEFVWHEIAQRLAEGESK